MTNPSLNILTAILDDDKDIHELIEKEMFVHGVKNYKFYTNAKDFLENLSADIHICVVDYYVDGGFTGLDIIRKVKSKNKHSYIIIMSGNVSMQVVIDCLNEGCDKYVNKNKPDYLKQLGEYIHEGLVKAQHRLELLNFIENRKKECAISHDCPIDIVVGEMKTV